MKLRNKQTGEIGYTAVLRSKAIVVMDENAIQLGSYASLAELNEEWEDAPKEPKEYWYIEADGSIIQNAKPGFINHLLDGLKNVGNYFETKEEAEQAVEKLRAWKRLKDKGFRFNGWNGTQVGSNISYISEFYYEGCSDDMDLLFCTEENS